MMDTSDPGLSTTAQGRGFPCGVDGCDAHKPKTEVEVVYAARPLLCWIGIHRHWQLIYGKSRGGNAVCLGCRSKLYRRDA